MSDDISRHTEHVSLRSDTCTLGAHKLTLSVIVDTKPDNSGAAKDKNKVAADCTDASILRFELRATATGHCQERVASFRGMKTLNNDWMSNEYAFRNPGRFAASFIGAAIEVVEEGALIKVIYTHGGDKKSGARTMIAFDKPTQFAATPVIIVDLQGKPTQG